MQVSPWGCTCRFCALVESGDVTAIKWSSRLTCSSRDGGGDTTFMKVSWSTSFQFKQSQRQAKTLVTTTKSYILWSPCVDFCVFCCRFFYFYFLHVVHKSLLSAIYETLEWQASNTVFRSQISTTPAVIQRANEFSQHFAFQATLLRPRLVVMAISCHWL